MLVLSSPLLIHLIYQKLRFGSNNILKLIFNFQYQKNHIPIWCLHILIKNSIVRNQDITQVRVENS